MDGVPPVRRRILDATVEAAAVFGIARLSVGDVARRAGLSRQTLYKHFASKEDLVAEAVLEETTRVVREVVAAAEPVDDVREALVVGVRTALELSRGHPLLDRLVRTEPETLVPLLTAGAGPVMVAVRAAVCGLAERKLPELDRSVVERGADVVARLLVSYAVGPPEEAPGDVAETLVSCLFDGMLATRPAA